MNLGPVQLFNPWFLVLALLVVPTIVLGWQRLRFSGRIRRPLLITLRVSIVLLVVLALSDPRSQLPNPAKSTVFLIDSSSSTAGFQAAASAWVRQALARMGPEDRAGVVAFAATPVVLQPLGQTRDFRPANLPTDSRTDIAGALRFGQSMLPSSGVRRLVLVSDGWENVGFAEQVVGELTASGIVVDVVKPRSPAVGAVVRSIDAPRQVREGEQFDVIVQVESVSEADATIRAIVDGEPASSQEVKLRNGISQFSLPSVATTEGFHRLTIVLESQGGTARSDSFFVARQKGKVLILEDRPGESLAVSLILERAGLSVETRRSATVPTSVAPYDQFDAIILANVAATTLTLDQQKTLQTYVRQLGKGIVFVGGPNSFSLGDYGSSTLGELLPVHAEIPPKPNEGTFGLALVIDKSGSMDLKADGVSKIQMAKEAAALAVDMLRDDDYIAIIVFDTNFRWLVQPQKVSDNRGVPAILARIYALQSDGGTDIYPALERGFEGIRGTDARYKHVILISDGQSPSGDYDQLLRSMRTSNVSLSSVAVGGDADTALMSRLARDGAGRYYFTERVRDIPRIVSKETQIAIGATTVQGRIQPQFVAPSPVLRGIVPASLPELNTYAVTSVRQAAETILVSPSGDPLLAHWQYGSGRTVAFTSSLREDWAARWGTFDDSTRLWGQIVRYAIGPPADSGLDVQVETRATTASISVDAVNNDGSFVDLAETTATVIAPSGRTSTVQLRQQAPGRYSIEHSAAEGGAHELRIRLRTPGQPERTDTLGFVAVADPETRTLAANDRLLRRISAATGGRQISAPESAFADGPKPSGLGWQPLWPWLLGAAMILFPIDVAARRLRTLPFVRRDS